MSSQSDESRTNSAGSRQQANKRRHTSLAAAALAAATTRRVRGANERIRVGVIGCGGRGGAHINILMNLKDQGELLDIVAVCDTYRPRLTRAADRTGAKLATMRHEELLANGDIDVVVVATPEHWHGYQTLDAMRAGKDVYVEKPLTHWSQLGLAEEVAEVSQQTGQLVQVGCQRLSSSVYPQARALIRKGAIGRPIMAETGYFRIGDWGERGMSIDDPNAKPGPDLDWERFLGDRPRRAFDVSRHFRWRMYWDTSGGPITDNYVHFYNPLAYMLDLGYPDRVIGSGDIHRYTLDEVPDPYTEREVPDTCNLIIDYPNKLTVTCLGTQGNSFTTLGSNETPIIRGWEATLTIEETEIVVRPIDTSKAEHREPIRSGINQNQFWTDFLECCRTRKQPISNAALSAPVNTTMQMGVLALRGMCVVRYDHENGRVIA